MNPPRPALREPMVWLVVALPALVVAASIATIVLAVRSGGSDAVRDEVHRTAQVQTAELGADARARELGLSAVLRLGKGTVEVLPAGGSFATAQPLQLTAVHPTSAAADVTLVLQPGALGWQASATLDPAHAWHLQLAPRDGTWRLRGHLPAGARSAHLGSAFADE